MAIFKRLSILLFFVSYQALAQDYWAVQVGAYQDKSNADLMKQQLGALMKCRMKKISLGQRTYYVVSTTASFSQAEALRMRDDLKRRLQLSNPMVVRETSVKQTVVMTTPKLPRPEPYTPNIHQTSWEQLNTTDKDGLPDNEVIVYEYPNDTAASGFYGSFGVGSSKTNVTLTRINPGTPPEFFLLQQAEISDTATIFSPTLGFDFYNRFNFPVRTELAYVHSNEYIAQRRLHQLSIHFGPSELERHFKWRYQTFMWNNYFDIHYFKAFIPYIGAGIGRVKTTGSTTHDRLVPGKQNETNYTWNAMVGAKFVILPNLMIGPVYQYIKLREIKYGQIDGPTEFFPVRANRPDVAGHLHANNFMVQIYYYFG